VQVDQRLEDVDRLDRAEDLLLAALLDDVGEVVRVELEPRLGGLGVPPRRLAVADRGTA